MKPTTKDYLNVTLMTGVYISAIVLGIMAEPDWIGQVAWITALFFPILTGGYGSMSVVGAYRRMNKIEKGLDEKLEEEKKEFKEILDRIFEPQVHIKEITFEDDKEEYIHIIKQLYNEAVMEENYERADALKKQAEEYNIKL